MYIYSRCNENGHSFKPFLNLNKVIAEVIKDLTEEVGFEIKKINTAAMPSNKAILPILAQIDKDLKLIDPEKSNLENINAIISSFEHYLKLMGKKSLHHSVQEIELNSDYLKLEANL